MCLGGEIKSAAPWCLLLSAEPGAGSPLPDPFSPGLIVRVCLGGNLSKIMSSSLAPYACENIGLETSRRQWKPVEHSSLVLIFFYSLFPPPPQWQDVCKSCHFIQLFIIIYLRILVKLSTERSVKFHIKTAWILKTFKYHFWLKICVFYIKQPSHLLLPSNWVQKHESLIYIYADPIHHV